MSAPTINVFNVRYLRHTLVPQIKNNEKRCNMELIDMNHKFVVYLLSENKPHRICLYSFESHELYQPIDISIPENSQIERFKMIHSHTAIVVITILENDDYGRRVLIIRSENEEWSKIRNVKMIDKEWTHKQRLDIVSKWKSSYVYLIETHYDIIPDQFNPDLADPLYTFHRLKMPDNESLPIQLERMNSVTDDMCAYDPLPSYSNDNKSILIIKTLFTHSPMDGSNNTICTESIDYPNYNLTNITIQKYKLDPLSRQIESSNKEYNVPLDIHINTEDSVVEMINGRLILNEPGGSLVFDEENNSYTIYKMSHSTSRIYQIKSIERNRIVGIAKDGLRSYLFHGYIHSSPSLFNISHSYIQSNFPQYISSKTEEYPLSHIEELIHFIFKS